MRAPLAWLKEFVDVPVEAQRLGEDLTLAGLELGAIEGTGDDAVLDFDITTNRVDCMNIHGLAREISVLYGVPLRPLELAFAESGPSATESLSVQVEASDLCPRFAARVLDVRLGPSPAWIRDRLEAVGVRAINNVVDLSNYVMMEMGHPSHAFDLARIPEGRLNVRWAEDGELLTTLDGVKRTLSSRNGVVAGPGEALALAGVMGGASSEVSETTEIVALEAAYWEPLAIRRGAKAISMHTEASHRFERGADPEGPVISIARFAHLLLKLGAGSVRPGLIDQYVSPRMSRSARLRTARLWQLLGCEVPEQRARAILEGLGFRAKEADAEAALFEIPSWRGDVTREADLIEEVVRHHGIDKIPSRLPPATTAGGLRPSQRIERELRGLLVAAGLTEVVNYAFVSDEDDESQVRLENPLSQEQGALRVSLVRPGLLDSLQTNLRQGRRDVQLFEIGRTFGAADGLPSEERRLGFVLHGPVHPAHWSEKSRSVDLFDASGLVDAVGQRLGAALQRTAEGVPAFLHPGKSAVIVLDGSPVGYVGCLHPELAQQLELREETVVGELRLDPLLEAPRRPARFQAFPRFPAVTRDLSILCDATVAAASLESRVREAAGERLGALLFVDRYDRPPVPAGKVSLTITLRFQDRGRTLTGEEVQESMDRVVRALEQVGMEIRGG